MSEGDLLVLKCRLCGDTFTLHDGDARVCPTCEASDNDLAQEPLL